MLANASRPMPASSAQVKASAGEMPRVRSARPWADAANASERAQ
jgi:hypothetical protein